MKNIGLQTDELSQLYTYDALCHVSSKLEDDISFEKLLVDIHMF